VATIRVPGAVPLGGTVVMVLGPVKTSVPLYKTSEVTKRGAAVPMIIVPGAVPLGGILESVVG